jgi:hypothetical protein
LDDADTDAEDEDEGEGAAGKTSTIKGLRSAHDVVFPSSALDGSPVKVYQQSGARDFQAILFGDVNKVPRRLYDLLELRIEDLAPKTAATPGAAAGLALHASPVASLSSEKKSVPRVSAHLRMVQDECKAFVTDRSLALGDIVRYAHGPSQPTPTQASQQTTKKKVKLDPVVLFEEFSPTFEWLWSQSAMRKSIPMSDELERAAQDLFNKGETSSHKYSPASASMHMLRTQEIARDWTSRLAISEDGVRKKCLQRCPNSRRKTQKRILSKDGARLTIRRSWARRRSRPRARRRPRQRKRDSSCNLICASVHIHVCILCICYCNGLYPTMVIDR